MMTGPLAPLRDRVAGIDDRRPCVPAARLMTRAAMSGAVARFARGLGCEPTAPVISIWSQRYLATVILPVAALSIATRRTVGAPPDRTGIVLGDDGEPVAIRLPDREDCDGRPLLDPLVSDHLLPFVEAVAGLSGLAPRVVWGSAAHYLDWIVRRLAADPATPDDVAREALGALDAPRLPDGRPNPLQGCIRYLPGKDGHTLRLRRTCCLRYRVPGIEDCGPLCPVPEGRRRT